MSPEAKGTVARVGADVIVSTHRGLWISKLERWCDETGGAFSCRRVGKTWTVRVEVSSRRFSYTHPELSQAIGGVWTQLLALG